MWSKISWHQICVQGQKYKSWFSPVQQDLSVLGIYNFGTLFLSFMWSSATLHPLRCDFSKKNTHSLDSDSDSWFLSQAEIIITVVWPYDKTKQIYKMTNFIQNGLKKLFGVKTVVILRICSILLSKHYSTVSHLFCTLISENQGLEKLRSVSNLRKISGPAQLNFFQYTWFFFSLSPEFFSDLYHKPEKIQETNWKKQLRCTGKKIRCGGPELFLRLITDLNFQKSRCRLIIVSAWLF